jgi:hypothetical protein
MISQETNHHQTPFSHHQTTILPYASDVLELQVSYDVEEHVGEGAVAGAIPDAGVSGSEATGDMVGDVPPFC